jgi:hypothetical protein
MYEQICMTQYTYLDALLRVSFNPSGIMLYNGSSLNANCALFSAATLVGCVQKPSAILANVFISYFGRFIVGG